MKSLDASTIAATNARSVIIQKLLEVYYIAKPYDSALTYMIGSIVSYDGGTYEATGLISPNSPPGTLGEGGEGGGSGTPIIIDNVDAGFSTVGTWYKASNSPGFYGANYVYSNNIANSATWTFNIPEAGDYELAAQWATNSNHTTTAQYTLVQGGTVYNAPLVNQTVNGGQFNSLGTVSLQAGTATVTLTFSNGYCSADAVQLTPLFAAQEPSELWVPIDNPMRITNSNQNVSFEGNTYKPGVFEIGEINFDADGKVNPVTLSIGNVDEDRFIQRLIEDHTILGQKVRVISMLPGITQAVTDIMFVSTGAKARKGQVDFTLSLGFEFLLKSIPGRTLRSKFCSWQFKDENCKYAGPDTECRERSWQECKAKFNTRNFGGFPGMPNSRFYF